MLAADSGRKKSVQGTVVLHQVVQSERQSRLYKRLTKIKKFSEKKSIYVLQINIAMYSLSKISNLSGQASSFFLYNPTGGSELVITSPVPPEHLSMSGEMFGFHSCVCV